MSVGGAVRGRRVILQPHYKENPGREDRDMLIRTTGEHAFFFMLSLSHD